MKVNRDGTFDFRSDILRSLQEETIRRGVKQTVDFLNRPNAILDHVRSSQFRKKMLEGHEVSLDDLQRLTK